MKIGLTIAGSDSSGGAGIQADIKTMTLNGVYAESAITALTAQNTKGVLSVLDSSPQFLKDQLDMIFDDIFPDSVKIGMVSNSDLILVIAEKLKEKDMYIVANKEGLRFAVCAVSEEKCKISPKIIKEVMDNIN